MISNTKKILFFMLIFLSALLQAQVMEQGYYQLKKIKSEKKTAETRLQFQFQGPDGGPVKSHLKFSVNNDTVKPVMNEKGMYSMAIEPGKYKFVFRAPWWYDVGTDSIVVKKGNPLSFFVHFEAKEISLKGMKK